MPTHPTTPTAPTRASHCSCGRPAREVVEGGRFGPTGYCGSWAVPLDPCDCGQGADLHDRTVCHVYGRGMASAFDADARSDAGVELLDLEAVGMASSPDLTIAEGDTMQDQQVEPPVIEWRVESPRAHRRRMAWRRVKVAAMSASLVGVSFAPSPLEALIGS